MASSSGGVAKRGLPPIPAFGIGWLYPVCLRLILRQSRVIPPDEVLPHNATLSNMPIGVRPAKRGLPPIPAFGIGWLYPVCPTASAEFPFVGNQVALATSAAPRSRERCILEWTTPRGECP